MSNNLDNLLTEIYSSEGQSQGVKELAVLINNLSQLLLKAISQLETRVLKMEQQMMSGGGGGGMPMQQQSIAPSVFSATPPAPKPKVASPFSAPLAPSPPPPPPMTAAPKSAPAPAAGGGGPSSVAEAASMLGVTLKKSPVESSLPSTTVTSSSSGPSFLTSTVSSQPRDISASKVDASFQPDAVAPSVESSGGGGIAAPGGGFRGELAEKLAKRKQKVQQQIEDDFDSDKTDSEENEIVKEESTSSELKVDLEDELRSAFSKLKG